MGRGDFGIILPGQIKAILQSWDADKDGPGGQPYTVDGGGVVSVVATYVLLNPLVNSTPMGPGFAPNIGYNRSVDPDPTVADMDDLSLELEFQEDCTCGDLHRVSMDFVRGTPMSFPCRQYSLYVHYPRNLAVAIETQPPIKAFASVGRGTMREHLLPRKTLRFGNVNAGGISTPQRIPTLASYVYFQNPTLTILDAPVVFRGGSNGPDIHATPIGKRLEGATLVPNGAQYVAIDNTAGAVAIPDARLVFIIAL